MSGCLVCVWANDGLLSCPEFTPSLPHLTWIGFSNPIIQDKVSTICVLSFLFCLTNLKKGIYSRHWLLSGNHLSRFNNLVSVHPPLCCSFPVS